MQFDQIVRIHYYTTIITHQGNVPMKCQRKNAKQFLIFPAGQQVKNFLPDGEKQGNGRLVVRFL